MNKVTRTINAGITTLTMLLALTGCYKEEFVGHSGNSNPGESFLSIDEAYAIVDDHEKFILYSIGHDTLYEYFPHIHFDDYSSIVFNDKALNNDIENDLGMVVVNKPYEIIAETGNISDTFDLFFTRIPIVHITCEYNIEDEVKILSDMSIQYAAYHGSTATSKAFNSYAGIEYRGATSQKYEKKSYGIELWENKIESDYSASLLGMRLGEDWILDAMYIDDLRMRNSFSFYLWEQMASVPLEDHRPEVIPGIQCKYVELFINNRYQGLYSLNEKLDETTLQYTNDQSEQGGVIYKAVEWSDGATTFDSYIKDPPARLYWDGWELIYPQEHVAWDPLAQLRQLVVESSDEEFKTKIGSLIDIDNAANYFIFINLTLAADNRGKNTYLARYTDQSRFFLIPWDLDATFGLFWDRTKLGTSGMVSNNLFDRLISTNASDFNSSLVETWPALRKNLLANENLISHITQHYHMLKTNGVIVRENERWESINIDLDKEYEFLLNWISSRLQYLDALFEEELEIKSAVKAD